MCVGNCTDGRIELGFVIFPKNYQTFKLILDKESLFRVFANVRFDEKYKKVELTINEIKKI